MTTLAPAQQLRQCTECGLVYVAGEPSAGRLPRTCPNDCQAAVVVIHPLTTNKPAA